MKAIVKKVWNQNGFSFWNLWSTNKQLSQHWFGDNGVQSWFSSWHVRFFWSRLCRKGPKKNEQKVALAFQQSHNDNRIHHKPLHGNLVDRRSSNPITRPCSNQVPASEAPSSAADSLLPLSNKKCNDVFCSRISFRTTHSTSCQMPRNCPSSSWDLYTWTQKLATQWKSKKTLEWTTVDC